MTTTVLQSVGTCVHLGCGDRRLPGYIHVDVRRLPGIDYVASADRMSFLDDSTVDLLYWCHGLEHVTPADVPTVLHELRRVLRPGSTLRLSVPDLRALAVMYATGHVQLSSILGALYGGQEYVDNTHHWGYDLSTMTTTLTTNGFHDIRLFNPATVFPPDYVDYSSYCIANWPISLNVEATK